MQVAQIKPMLLCEAKAPFSDPAWAFELKHDGYRLLAGLDGGKVELRTRGGADATRWFPETVRGLSGLGGRHVLDGEICVLDDLGRSDFDSLHARALTRRYKPGAPLAAYLVFDILVADGEDVMGVPFAERKRRLAEILAKPPGGVLAVSYMAGEGAWLFQQAVALKLEGIVAKRLDSIYVPGARSRDWLKIKRKGAVPAQRFQRGRDAG